MKFTIRIAVSLSAVLYVLGNYGGALERQIQNGWSESSRFVEGHIAIRVYVGETRVFGGESKTSESDRLEDDVAKNDYLMRTSSRK